MKYCKDCEHFCPNIRWKESKRQDYCAFSQKKVDDPVWGYKWFKPPLARAERSKRGSCGPEAKNFKAKEIEWRTIPVESPGIPWWKRLFSTGDGGSMKVLRLKPNIHVTNVRE